MTDFPAHELDLFLDSVTVAVDHARAGWTALGWRELSYDHERASELVAYGKARAGP